MLCWLSSGCANVQPVHGSFQQVCDELVGMSVTDRAMNWGQNGKVYQEKYGLNYDPVVDELYTKNASGGRDIVLKGDLMRATFLIDNRKR